MKLNEVFTVQHSIFGGIFEPNFTDEFNVIFGDVGALATDVYVLMQWGNKQLVDLITPDNADEIVKSVIAINLNGWLKQCEVMTADYNPMNPTIETTDRSETVKTDETANGENLSANKAFNDIDFTDGSRDTDSRTADRTETRTYKETKSGVGSKDFADVAQKELRLRRDNWRKFIIFALVKEITKDIY